jgi:hypothetical protein
MAVREDVDENACKFKWREFNMIKREGNRMLEKIIKMGFKNSCFDFEGMYIEALDDVYSFELNPRAPIDPNLFSENCGKGMCLYKF